MANSRRRLNSASTTSRLTGAARCGRRATTYWLISIVRARLDLSPSAANRLATGHAEAGRITNCAGGIFAAGIGVSLP